jgi:hypothetical protein
VLQLKNKTPFKATILPLPDADGIDTVYTVVKGTFAIGRETALAEEQVPVTLADEHYGEPGASSIRRPSDMCLGKPGTDVVLIGSAWAPGGRPVWQMDVSVRVGPLSKSIRVSGDRVWESGPSGAAISWLAPFEQMPLVWERAFGGQDETDAGPVVEPRNPVGCGFRAPHGTKRVQGLRVPNLEDPATPISSPSGSPAPVCFGPVGSHWQPRCSFAGTYDEVWQKQRAPYLPTDFDSRFFQIAPAGLIAPSHLNGGEPVDVRGATPSGVLSFPLPTTRLQVNYRLDSAVQSRTAELNTVIIEPDEGRLVMVWHAALRCDKKVLKVQEIEVALPHLS